MSDFGKRLKAYREALGLSLQQVNEQTGITNSRLSRIEKGTVECPPIDLKKLARVYGLQTIPLFMEAEYLDQEDVAEYQFVFRGVSELDEEERCHIQEQIDFIIKKRGG